MRALSVLPVLSLVVLFSLSMLSCTKEVVRETIVQKDSIIIRKDSIIIRKDSIITKQDVLKLLQKKWSFLSHEIEEYNGSIVVDKRVENFSARGFFTEFHPNKSYTNLGLGGNFVGTWNLLADNYYVLDQNTSNERYYYILSISETNLIVRGPFSRNNQLVTNFLFTGYYKSTI